MEEILYIISTVVQVILTVIQIAMLLRAILSWFPIEPNGFTEFLFSITEPFIYPFRALFNRLNWFQDIPIDVAFSAAYIALFIISILLP
ncbi:MAG: YggT family protein [Clostridia bacterium]|nr:YggT family protein [Clostridia bacterium]